MTAFLFILVLIAAVSLVQGNSNGSPVCSVDANSMASGMGGSNANLGCKLETSGNTITVTGSGTFKGLLLWTTDASIAFSVPSGYKKMSGCSGFSLTQSSDSPKSFPAAFTISGGEANKTFTVNAVIVKDSKTNWQILGPITATGTGTPKSDSTKVTSCCHWFINFFLGTIILTLFC